MRSTIGFTRLPPGLPLTPFGNGLSGTLLLATFPITDLLDKVRVILQAIRFPTQAVNLFWEFYRFNWSYHISPLKIMF
jgi:hypothetical protein